MSSRRLLIYIHGFLSSPRSIKAVETQGYVANYHAEIDVLVPLLSDFPDQAYQQLVDLIESNLTRYEHIALIGSSLGGFYATALAEQYALRAVLVNPAVNPAQHRFLTKYEGEHINPYTQVRFVLNATHREALAALYCPRLSYPHSLWLMVQTGDEVLDYRDAVAYYDQSPQLIECGGNHRFDRFAQHLPAIIQFLYETP